jgi:hypothetical protein
MFDKVKKVRIEALKRILFMLNQFPSQDVSNLNSNLLKLFFILSKENCVETLNAIKDIFYLIDEIPWKELISSKEKEILGNLFYEKYSKNFNEMLLIMNVSFTNEEMKHWKLLLNSMELKYSMNDAFHFMMGEFKKNPKNEASLKCELVSLDSLFRDQSLVSSFKRFRERITLSSIKE